MSLPSAKTPFIFYRSMIDLRYNCYFVFRVSHALTRCSFHNDTTLSCLDVASGKYKLYQVLQEYPPIPSNSDKLEVNKDNLCTLGYSREWKILRLNSYAEVSEVSRQISITEVIYEHSLMSKTSFKSL